MLFDTFLEASRYARAMAARTGYAATVVSQADKWCVPEADAEDPRTKPVRLPPDHSVKTLDVEEEHLKQRHEFFWPDHWSTTPGIDDYCDFEQ